MALSPKLTTQIPWDATLAKNLPFTYSGNQVYANKIIIRDNLTNTIVYSSKTTSFQLYASISPNILLNGTTYNAQLSVFDINDVESPLSQSIIFQCLSTPIVAFSNLINDQIIRNSYYNFTFTYTQTENELLNNYQIILYDSNKLKLSATDTSYNTTMLSGTLSGFIDNNQYFVKVTGITVNGMAVDSGYVSFSVDYIAPTNWSKLILENTNDGMVKLSSNVTLITGKSIPDTPTYIDNTKIDLTANGSKVYFDSDFTIENDFCLEILGQKFTPYSTIAEFSNENNKIEIKYMFGFFTVGGSQQMYVVLNAYNSYACSRVCSTPMAVPSDNQQVYILINRVNNLFDLKVTLK